MRGAMLFYSFAFLILAAVSDATAIFKPVPEHDWFNATQKTCNCRGQHSVGVVDIFTFQKHGDPLEPVDRRPTQQKVNTVYEWTEACFEPLVQANLSPLHQQCISQRKAKKFAWCHKDDETDISATICFNPFHVEWDYQEEGQPRARIFRPRKVRTVKFKWITITPLDVETCTNICRTHTREEDWPNELRERVMGVCHLYEDNASFLDAYAAYIDPATSKWHRQKGPYNWRTGCQEIKYRRMTEGKRSAWGGVRKDGKIDFP